MFRFDVDVDDENSAWRRELSTARRDLSTPGFQNLKFRLGIHIDEKDKLKVATIFFFSGAGKVDQPIKKLLNTVTRTFRHKSWTRETTLIGRFSWWSRGQ